VDGTGPLSTKRWPKVPEVEKVVEDNYTMVQVLPFDDVF